MVEITSKDELLAAALLLGAGQIKGWSSPELQLAKKLPTPRSELVEQLALSIKHGKDPLGELFCQLHSPEQRRASGAVYTPLPIVKSMLRWSSLRIAPQRVIDPGTGSARFLAKAGRIFKNAELIGVEQNPFAAILARGHLAAAGLAERSQVLYGDYRQASIGQIHGRTLFIGNPPYVRHHLIEPRWKEWLTRTAAKYGYKASALAGLHVYFFLATAEFARIGDVGIFITAAEWLDVNYGNLVRELFLEQLGGTDLQVVEPAALPFPGTATTAVISGFTVGTRPRTIGLRRIDSLKRLGLLRARKYVHRGRFEGASRWSPLTRVISERRTDFVELGELCRVHRGTVTGANKVWIAGKHSLDLPESVLYPSVTRAKELIRLEGVLVDPTGLKDVIDIPADLDVFEAADRSRIDRFLKYAKRQGADQGYIARHRKAWWAVGLRNAAPILATYMARRPPAFVRNLADARHINIAHGLYPREVLSETILQALVLHLAQSVSTDDGRTYAGGLTKFEPREMERLLVPTVGVLEQMPLFGGTAE